MSKKVLFLYLGTENLGIEALSAYLKSKEIDVELLMDPARFSGYVLYNSPVLASLFDKKAEPRLRDAVRRSCPDVICFSVFTGNYQWALKWAGICKELFPHAPIIFGGVHASSLPEQVISQPQVDMVIVGEAEDALLEVLEQMDGNTLPAHVANTVLRKDGRMIRNPVRPYIRDLDAYPVLDKKLYYDKIPDLEDCYLTLTGRGCPFRCTYCVNNVYHGIYSCEKSHVRRRSVESVISELKRVKSRGIAKKIFFGDDVFIFNKLWLTEFAAQYRKEVALPFWCTAHPNMVDKEVVDLLKSAGCWLVTMGVQSGSPRVRQEVFERHESDGSIKKASRLIMDAGILLGLDNIFGAPSETEEDLKASFLLYAEIKPDRLHTFWLTYFPKTTILSYALQCGDLREEDIRNIEEGNVGQFDFGGSVKKNMSLYLRYEFLHHLHALTGYHDKTGEFLLRHVGRVPASMFINKILIALTAIRTGDAKFYYLIRSLFFKRQVP